MPWKNLAFLLLVCARLMANHWRPSVVVVRRWWWGRAVLVVLGEGLKWLRCRDRLFDLGEDEGERREEMEGRTFFVLFGREERKSSRYWSQKFKLLKF